MCGCDGKGHERIEKYKNKIAKSANYASSTPVLKQLDRLGKRAERGIGR